MSTNSSAMNTDHKIRRQSGFSLIEVLIVIAILAVLAGLSVTTLMRWIPEANLKRAGRTVASMCQFARVEAIKRNAPISVNCTGDSCFVRLADNTQLRRFDFTNVGSNVQLANAFSTNFNSRGRALTSGTIIIQNNAGNSLTIRVRPSGSIVTE